MGDRLCNPGGLPQWPRQKHAWDRASVRAGRPGQQCKRTIGTSTKEAIRCLKRHLARRLWHLLQPPTPDQDTTKLLT
jgi:hypothetical protein